MSGVSIRTRLTASYLAVLTAATLTLAGGAWYLLRASMTRAADASLAARIEGTRHFIDAVQRGLPKEELLDEFQEFADLTSGETLLEVTDEDGRRLCHPALAGWETLPARSSPSSDALPVANDIAGQPYRALSTTLEVGGHRYRVTTAIPMSTADAALRRFGWLLAGLVPAVLLIAAAGGFWLSGRALAPVDRITRDVQQISVTDPARRLDVPPAGDELSRLAETFNGMLVRWQSAFADMIRFTADASHELRTPVSLARTTAELALHRPRTSDEYRTALSDVLVQTERMSTLVDSLLTLARADAGVEPPPTTSVDLRDIARTAVHDTQPAVDRHGLQLALSVPPSAVAVSGHRESLSRLVLILLDNAVKYTPSGGSIRLAISTTSNGAAPAPAAIIEVVDSGPGIRPEDRGRVFDRFYRGAPAREAAPDGSGLGLSIARTIVERHGGSVRLTDPASGSGCRVEVSLPLQAAPTSPPIVRPL
jgi:heavy metal sensor kinase